MSRDNGLQSTSGLSARWATVHLVVISAPVSVVSTTASGADLDANGMARALWICG